MTMLEKGEGLKVEHAVYAVDTIAIELDLKFNLTQEDVQEIEVFEFRVSGTDNLKTTFSKLASKKDKKKKK